MQLERLMSNSLPESNKWEVLSEKGFSAVFILGSQSLAKLRKNLGPKFYGIVASAVLAVGALTISPEAIAETSSQPELSPPLSHQVVEGDTLYNIATKYKFEGEDVNVALERIYKTNPDAFDGSASRLKVGSVLDLSLNNPMISSNKIASDLSKVDRKSLKNSEKAVQVFEAFKSAGFTDVQSKQLTGQIFRENSFHDRYLFGTHRDPANKITNIGMISWQKERAVNLDKFLMDIQTKEGIQIFDENGKMLRNQDTLNAQARFIMHEMQTNTHNSPNPEYHQNKRIHAWLATESPSDEMGRQAVGADFIRWRSTDSVYAANGNKNIDAGYRYLNEGLNNYDLIIKGVNDNDSKKAHNKNKTNTHKQYKKG